MSYLEPREYENDRAKVKITFANKTDEEREVIFTNVAQAIYDLCLNEYKKEMGITNENKNNTGATKST